MIEAAHFFCCDHRLGVFPDGEDDSERKQHYVISLNCKSKIERCKPKSAGTSQIRLHSDLIMYGSLRANGFTIVLFRVTLYYHNRMLRCEKVSK